MSGVGRPQEIAIRAYGCSVWRARTEEAHLLAEDAKYREYHAWMERAPTITRALARLIGAVRPRRMVAQPAE